jgi:hypothetical protein
MSGELLMNDRVWRQGCSQAVWVRSMAIVLVPQDGKLAIEVRGDLVAILALSTSANTRPSGRVHEDLLVQVKLIAGAGFEPATFRS